VPDEFNTEGGYVSFYKSIKLKNTCHSVCSDSLCCRRRKQV